MLLSFGAVPSGMRFEGPPHLRTGPSSRPGEPRALPHPVVPQTFWHIFIVCYPVPLGQ